MKVHLLALGVILLASWGIAEETVILSDGSRMQVRSVAIRRNVAVIETLEGVLQSLPLAYIDVEATMALVSDEPAASALPADRDARVRWALEHYGGRELLDSYVETLTDLVEADPDAIPEKLRDELIQNFTAAFDREEIFGEITQSFLSDVDSETVDRWARWLESPVAAKAMALESAAELRAMDEGSAFLDAAGRARVPERRRVLLLRLEDASMALDTLYEMYAEALSGMVAGVKESSKAALGKSLGTWGADAAPEITPEVKETFLGYFHNVYEPLSDSELDAYVRFWESPSGRAVAQARRRASVGGLRNAGFRTGAALAAVYDEYGPVAAADLPDAELAETSSIETHVFDALNFEFTAPVGWASFDVSNVSATAKVGYLRNDPLVAFMITAEDGGSDTADITSELAASIVRAGLESTVRHFELLSEKPYPLSGMDGFLVVSNAQSANQDLYSCSGSM